MNRNVPRNIDIYMETFLTTHKLLSTFEIKVRLKSRKNVIKTRYITGKKINESTVVKEYLSISIKNV